MTVGTVVQRLHLWAGVVLGIQVFLWMLSGVVMSWYHIDLVRGERSAFSALPPELEARSYASPGGVIAQTDGALEVTLLHFLGQPAYEVEGVSGAVLFDASTGEKLSPLSEDVVRKVAEADYVGDGTIKSLTLMDNPPAEYEGRRPVWRADFNDVLNTRLYISPGAGRVISRRNNVWRLYDFFWMLHIMDYADREDFNNPIVKAFSAGGLFFAMTGLVMLVTSRGRRQIVSDVKWVLRGGRRQGGGEQK